MLIVTADDYGKTRQATDKILKCFSNRRITSTSAMVLMEDSERAAELSLQTELEVGLHLNFTAPFSADKISRQLREYHNRVVSYLTKNKLAQIIYNPFLADSFKSLFLLQKEEFMRLYGRSPDFYNGHHHMHLCANILVGAMIPKGARVRGTFTFDRDEKNPFNRLYRHILKIIISKKYISTDSFFSILPIHNYERLQSIVSRSARETVEIEVHPENSEEMDFLLSDRYLHLIDSVHRDRFQEVDKRKFE